MKKFLAAFAAAVFALSLSSCGGAGEMPEPFLESETDVGDVFYSTVDTRLGYIDMMFIDLVDADEFSAWIAEASSSDGRYTAVDEFANLCSFIKHFNIPEGTVREILTTLRTGSEDDFSDEDIEILLTGSAEEVAERFASETAVRKGKNLYSLGWIYFHTEDDYKAAGIAPADILPLIPLYDSCGLTPEAAKAIKKKLEKFAS